MGKIKFRDYYDAARFIKNAKTPWSAETILEVREAVMDLYNALDKNPLIPENVKNEEKRSIDDLLEEKRGNDIKYIRQRCMGVKSQIPTISSRRKVRKLLHEIDGYVNTMRAWRYEGNEFEVLENLKNQLRERSALLKKARGWWGWIFPFICFSIGALSSTVGYYFGTQQRRKASAAQEKQTYNTPNLEDFLKAQQTLENQTKALQRKIQHISGSVEKRYKAFLKAQQTLQTQTESLQIKVQQISNSVEKLSEKYSNDHQHLKKQATMLNRLRREINGLELKIESLRRKEQERERKEQERPNSTLATKTPTVKKLIGLFEEYVNLSSQSKYGTYFAYCFDTALARIEMSGIEYNKEDIEQFARVLSTLSKEINESELWRAGPFLSALIKYIEKDGLVVKLDLRKVPFRINGLGMRLEKAHLIVYSDRCVGDVGYGLNGATLEVYGNIFCHVGCNMKKGKIIIHGTVEGDEHNSIGYDMKTGEIFVESAFNVEVYRPNHSNGKIVIKRGDKISCCGYSGNYGTIIVDGEKRF